LLVFARRVVVDPGVLVNAAIRPDSVLINLHSWHGIFILPPAAFLVGIRKGRLAHTRDKRRKPGDVCT
jgi:hypothetical protein